LVWGLVFLVNKYFEWGGKFDHGIFPGSAYLINNFSQGEILFFGLYFIMTGLHALHIIIGLVLIVVTMWQVYVGTVHADRSVLLENTGFTGTL
jgi:cytochrome c oxidase subunit III